MIDIIQIQKWTDEIINLQNSKKYQETADLVKNIYAEFENLEFRANNDLEWVIFLLDEKTLDILNS